MQRGLLMLLFGAAFTLLGLFAMPMKRANARQNLIDNPFGWGLFGFGLSSLLVGISAMMKERKEPVVKEQVNEQVNTYDYPIEKEEKLELESQEQVH